MLQGQTGVSALAMAFRYSYESYPEVLRRLPQVLNKTTSILSISFPAKALQLLGRVGLCPTRILGKHLCYVFNRPGDSASHPFPPDLHNIINHKW